MLEGKRILVTGGTGSMGRTFVHRVLAGELGTPRKVIVFSRDEAKQHDMRMAYLHRTVTTDEVIFNNFRNVLEFRIGDVRDFGDVCSALKDADIVINAAAFTTMSACFSAEQISPKSRTSPMRNSSTLRKLLKITSSVVTARWR